jgi:hypothetical protein
MKFLYEPESISKATWSLLANNIINPSSFLILTVIEGVTIIFYALLMQQLMFKQLEKDVGDDDQNTHDQMTFSLRFIIKYQEITSGGSTFLITVAIALVVFYLLLIASLCFMITISRKKIMKEL